ncbi:hypothetical protein FSS13T_07350 [Flavobacterium saliperosum S13]|uniref:Lipoprotein n=2 Tax=Flavobacterium saliperosum TaxID=329186 RepID=A0A1G4W0G4_9FLAO|nr:hypothetical protein [Flavobacterium saliperosum]ESU27474.1 hypothetical protein FSS13T_07350 [Flavobacterium saliperosum S13]SCX14759.1 hypothetical protein SAMN02927925_02123 [Flavobacterium saliperosum]
MKIIVHSILAVLLLTSCDFILKDHSTDDAVVVDQKPVVLGNDKDDKGCVASAGYMWSETRKGCIRVFEEGFRLTPYRSQADSVDVDGELVTLNAYVVFSEDKAVAELFLPNAKKSLLLKRESEGKPYVQSDWMLEAWKGYVLKKGNQIEFVSAVAVEKKIIGSDVGE